MNSTSEPKGRSSSLCKILFVAAVLLLAGVLAFAAVSVFSRAMDRYHHRVRVQQASSQLINNAVLQAGQAVEKNAESFDQFILSRKGGSRAFAKEVSSMYGKWRAVKPHLPFTDSDGHKQYVQEVFEKHVMSRGDLAGALKRSIEGAVRDVEGIQNDLAVNLRQEIAGCHLEGHDIAVAQQDFKDSIQRLVSASQRDATSAAVNLVVSEVVSMVASKVLVKLGVEAGILAVGAADSWWTFGASLVVGLIVDVVWGWIDNPVGKIENAVNQSLDKVARDGKAALVTEMGKLVVEKRKLWEAATADMIKNLKEAK
jgi:hypothetical protein